MIDYQVEVLPLDEQGIRRVRVSWTEAVGHELVLSKEDVIRMREDKQAEIETHEQAILRLQQQQAEFDAMLQAIKDALAS